VELNIYIVKIPKSSLLCQTLFIVLFRNVVSSIPMGPIFFYLCSRNCCCHSLRNAQETQIWEVSINTLLVHESLWSRNFVNMFLSLPGDLSIAEVWKISQWLLAGCMIVYFLAGHCPLSFRHHILICSDFFQYPPFHSLCYPVFLYALRYASFCFLSSIAFPHFQ